MASANGRGLYNYVADSGEIHPVFLNDVTLTLNISGTAQQQPAGPPTSEFFAKVSRGKTEYGLKPRSIGVCFTGTAPADLEAGPTYKVTVLTPGEFANATLTSLVNYQGEEARVVTRTPESIYPIS